LPEEGDLLKIELAFLNKPPNLLEESFCAEIESDIKKKAGIVRIYFIGRLFCFQM
jgi:hypothetical protein